MPTFNNKGLHFVSLITGPTHVLLGLEWGDETRDENILIEVTSPIGEHQHAPIDQNKMKQTVLSAVKEMSQSASVPLAIRRIRYVANDSPDYRLYEQAARLLAEQEIRRSQEGQRLKLHSPDAE